MHWLLMETCDLDATEKCGTHPPAHLPFWSHFAKIPSYLETVFLQVCPRTGFTDARRGTILRPRVCPNHPWCSPLRCRSKRKENKYENHTLSFVLIPLHCPQASQLLMLQLQMQMRNKQSHRNGEPVSSGQAFTSLLRERGPLCTVLLLVPELR